MQTAKTQRWPPHELLATLVREEIASREASNERARLKAAGFPAPKTLESFDIKVSSLPRPTFEFLASLEWLERKDNLCLAGPAGVGKSHLAQALGRVAITAGRKVRFFAADQLVEALYRGLADNTVGKLIERLLRHDFIVIDDLGYTALDRVAADHLFRSKDSSIPFFHAGCPALSWIEAKSSRPDRAAPTSATTNHSTSRAPANRDKLPSTAKTSRGR